MIERLMVFYASSLDHRRIDQQHTPYLSSLMGKFPFTKICSVSAPDLIPTLLTGLYPHEHGIWEVQLKPDEDLKSQSAFNYLPDIVTTTSQCLIHLLKGPYDLAAVPYWRRSRFDICKTRYVTREKKYYLTINGHDTILKMIGDSNCDYVFNSELDKLDNFASKIFQSGLRFELAQDYGLDRRQHWYLDNKQVVLDSYNKIDGFIKYLHSECESKDITLMILSDHGMELVKNSVDITRTIKELGIRKEEMTYFIEAPKARFWFHSDSAREKMLNYLSENPDGMLLSWEDMHEFNVKFEFLIFYELF